jgi:hypothetical protein
VTVVFIQAKPPRETGAAFLTLQLRHPAGIAFFIAKRLGIPAVPDMPQGDSSLTTPPTTTRPDHDPALFIHDGTSSSRLFG